MDTENIRAIRLDTVLKELLGSVIAYNMVGPIPQAGCKAGTSHSTSPEFQGRVAFVYLSPAARMRHEFQGMAVNIDNRPGSRVKTPTAQPTAAMQLSEEGCPPPSENYHSSKCSLQKPPANIRRLKKQVPSGVQRRRVNADGTNLCDSDDSIRGTVRTKSVGSPHMREPFEKSGL
jgi:hypothetical protein